MNAQYIGQVIDGLGIPVAVVSPIDLPDDSTLTQAANGMGVWAQAVDSCIDGSFREVSTLLRPNFPGGLKPPAGDTWARSDAAFTGNIQFSAQFTNNRFGFALPTFSQALVLNGKFDMSNPNVVALIDLLTNPTNIFTNWSDQSLVAALDAWLAFRQRSTRLGRTRAV